MEYRNLNSSHSESYHCSPITDRLGKKKEKSVIHLLL